MNFITILRVLRTMINTDGLRTLLPLPHLALDALRFGAYPAVHVARPFVEPSYAPSETVKVYVPPTRCTPPTLGAGDGGLTIALGGLVVVAIGAMAVAGVVLVRRVLRKAGKLEFEKVGVVRGVGTGDMPWADVGEVDYSGLRELFRIEETFEVDYEGIVELYGEVHSPVHDDVTLFMAVLAIFILTYCPLHRHNPIPVTMYIDDARFQRQSVFQFVFTIARWMMLLDDLLKEFPPQTKAEKRAEKRRRRRERRAEVDRAWREMKEAEEVERAVKEAMRSWEKKRKYRVGKRMAAQGESGG